MHSVSLAIFIEKGGKLQPIVILTNIVKEQVYVV
jgi:hypothetical protein